MGGFGLVASLFGKFSVKRITYSPEAKINLKKKKKQEEKQTQLHNPLVGCLNVLLFNRLSVQVNLNWKLWAEHLLSWPGKLAV